MSINIPHAGGLVSELEKRVKGELTVSEPRVDSRFGGHLKIASIDVAVDGEKLGTVTVSTYERSGVTRVHYVDYFGRMPGYINESAGDEMPKDQVRMAASETPSGQMLSDIDRHPEQPNNTPEKPLYRQDGHSSLRLADHEVDDGMFRYGLIRKVFEK